MVKKTKTKEIESVLEMKIGSEFHFVHPVSGDEFWYSDADHRYYFKEKDWTERREMPGTTTPLKLINELSWNDKGVMTDKITIIKNWAVSLVANDVIDRMGKLIEEKESIDDDGTPLTLPITLDEVQAIVAEAKKKPNQIFKGAGISGTQIHLEIEKLIKMSIEIRKDGYLDGETSEFQQVQNFIDWAVKHHVKFLYSEVFVYSKEWFHGGTIDFVCEIDGKVLIGDIKTNGDKRRYEKFCKFGKWIEDKSKPVSDIYITGVAQTMAYGKMAVEVGARNILEKFDGVVVVNIKKSGEFDEKLDTRYAYNKDEYIQAFGFIVGLYGWFKNNK